MPNSATLVQALGAAFCAILCALSGMGGGGMRMAQHVAAWAKSGYTAKDYVQDGLIAMWDGIENAGWGVHDTNAKKWADLVGENDMSFTSSLLRVENSCLFVPASYAPAAFSKYDTGLIKTVEIVIKPDGFNGQVFAVFSYENGDANRWFGIRSNSTFNFAQRGDFGNVQTPTELHYYAGTSDSEDLNDVPFSHVYLDGVEVSKSAQGLSWHMAARTSALNTNATVYSTSRIYSIRLYDKELTASEVAANYAIDKARFNIPDAA